MIHSIYGGQSGPAALPTTEEYDTAYGKFTIAKHDPYGFRRLHWDQGQLPEEYNCDYTTPMAARFAKDKFIKELDSAQEEARLRSGQQTVQQTRRPKRTARTVA